MVREHHGILPENRKNWQNKMDCAKKFQENLSRAFSKFPLQKGAGYITIKASKPFRIERKQKEELK